jgi:dipeptidase E
MSQFENLSIIAVGGKSPTGKASSILAEGPDLTGEEKGGNVLVIPTARPTAETHARSIAMATELYSERLRLATRILHDFESMPSEQIIDEQLDWADLVYISGGDTDKMMNVWRKYGLDTKLKVRALGGLVLSGISAGAIAPFKWGHSDWEHYHTDDENWEFRKVNGLNLINAAITPHYDSIDNGKNRSELFKDMFSHIQDTKIGLGIDNFGGIKIHASELQVKSATEGAGAALLDKRAGQDVSVTRLDSDQVFTLKELGLAD